MNPLKAELTGDPIKIAEANLAVAEERLEPLRLRLDAGVITTSDYLNAQTAVNIAKIKLQEAKTEKLSPIPAKYISIGGEVKKPQQIPLTPDLTVLGALDAAGGLTQFANRTKVHLIRDRKIQVININGLHTGETYDPVLDARLQPGDIIDVPSTTRY